MSRSTGRVQSLKVGAAAQMLPLLAGYSTNIFTTPYVLSQIGLHDFGLWSITGAIAQYAALLDLGVSRAANRYVALFHARGDTKSESAVVTICVIALLALGTLLSALAMSIPNLVDRVIGTGSPELARLLLLCAVSIMIMSLLARVLAAASMGRGRLVPAGAGVAILSTLQAVGGVAALVFHTSLPAFALGTVGGTALGLFAVVAIILFDERRIAFGMPEAALAREVLLYGVNSQVAAAGDLMLLQSGKLIAGIMVGPAAAGVYDLASRLALGAQAFGGASAAALTPHLTRSYIAGGMADVLNQYERLTRRQTAVGIFVAFALAATSFSAIPLWLGHEQKDVVLVLLALLLGIGVNVSTGVCTSTVSALGRPSINAAVTTVAGVLQSIFAVTLGYAFGFAGIAVAFAIGVPLAKFLGLWCMQARIGIPLKFYIRGARGPYAVGLIATAVSLPIGLFASPHTRESAIWPFLASGILFCATYALLGWSRDYLPQLPFRLRRSS